MFKGGLIMAVAPTPPTKPTPPVAPTLTPAGTQNSSEQQSAAPAVPAASAQSESKPISPEVAGAVKKIEEIGKAFQGMPTKPKTGEQAKPAVADDKPNNGQPALPAVGNTQNVVTAQSAIAPEPVVNKSNPSIVTFIPFFVGVVVLVAVILVGMRLFNNRSAKSEQPNTDVDYLKNKVANRNKEGVEIIIGPSSTAPKRGRNFETKV
jgi:hypothetical protein